MRAWVVKSYAGIDGLELRTLPEPPAPGPGQVLVRLRAASLNHRELLLLKGAYAQWCKPEFILGSDGAGEVVEVGAGVRILRRAGRAAPSRERPAPGQDRDTSRLTQRFEVIMTTTNIDARALRELIDRQQILDCIHRYCRGVDRFDREMVLSVYHEDAIDDHGVFVGNPSQFVAWAFAYHSEHQHATHHIVTNHLCELDGDTAHTETYWIFSGINKVGPPSIHFGRYIDRFERRNGRWAIASRACLSEWHAMLGELPMPAEVQALLDGSGPSARDRSDTSYERPLIRQRR